MHPVILITGHLGDRDLKVVTGTYSVCMCVGGGGGGGHYVHIYVVCNLGICAI